jgi:glutamate N-acetyltransferase/amino-acid N-acetyltransferase
MDKILRGIALAADALAAGPEADAHAARAILTTDLVPKHAQRDVALGTATVCLGGIAKGSGMIAPNMATMLVFITTDAAIDPKLLKQALRDAVSASFNRISVDSDTSTSDSVLILASGAAQNPRIDAPGEALDAFTAGLTELCQDLAYQVVQDGEGATRVFRVRVTGARSVKDADRVGRAVVDSPLVKTAVHGSDPNWGRLAMAVGKSGAAFDPAALRIAIGDTAVYQRQMPIDLTPDRGAALGRVMSEREIVFRIDLGKGDAAVQWLGCDLSRQYVTINADYTT